VQDLLDYFEQAGVAVRHRTTPLCPTPNDLSFIEVALAAVAPLISGNLRHYQTQMQLRHERTQKSTQLQS
jgi:hypothetical protein